MKQNFVTLMSLISSNLHKFQETLTDRQLKRHPTFQHSSCQDLIYFVSTDKQQEQTNKQSTKCNKQQIILLKHSLDKEEDECNKC